MGGGQYILQEKIEIPKDNQREENKEKGKENSLPRKTVRVQKNDKRFSLLQKQEEEEEEEQHEQQKHDNEVQEENQRKILLRDPNLKIGSLKNGHTYYIKHNPTHSSSSINSNQNQIQKRNVGSRKATSPRENETETDIENEAGAEKVV